MSKKRLKKYSRHPYLQKRRSGIYYIYHHQLGSQIRVSTRSRKRAVAEDALKLYEQDLAAGHSPVAVTLTMHTGISKWLEDRQSPRNGLKTSTLSGYKTFAKKLKGALPPRLLVRDFCREHVRLAFDKLAREGESQIQVAKCQTALSQVSNFLIAEGHLSTNPCVKVAPAAQYEKQVAMSLKEYQALLAAMEAECHQPSCSSSVEDLKDLAELCWHTGFRFIEWTRIGWSDVDFVKKTVATRSSKNKGGARTRRLTGSAFKILERRRKHQGKVFVGTSARLMTEWRRFRDRHPEFADARFHGMRGAFVTRIHSKLGPLAAMTLAGHSSSAMLDLYTDASQVEWDAKMDVM
jgi:integrase